MRSAHLCFLGLAVVTAPAGAVDPPIVQRDSSLVIEQLPPGARVAVLGVTRQTKAHVLRVTHTSVALEDDDRDGAITLPIEPVTGSVAILAIEMSAGIVGRLVSASELEAERLTEEPSVVAFAGLAEGSLLWVRPGIGAWFARIGDGSELDALGPRDLPDGWLGFEASTGSPYEGSPGAPPAFEDGDLIGVIEPMGLTGQVFELDAKGWVAR